MIRPPLLSSKESYLNSLAEDSSKKMVELRSVIPNIRYDLRYATKNNFVGRKMYPASTSVTFLRLLPALALKQVQDDLNKKGLGLKIFDAYRPYAVTVKFWELIKDERYVANPSRGSGHNRGVSVDLTVIELSTGIELDMGTSFDNFTDSAHHDFKLLPSQILENRNLLRSLMEKNGFRPLSTEWWHYSWPEPAKYDILDLSFRELKRSI